jgi:hypothetical protein
MSHNSQRKPPILINLYVLNTDVTVKVGMGIVDGVVPQSSCIANVVGLASHNILESSLALRMLEFCEFADFYW